MADVTGDASIASWVQAGGVGAFAIAVLVQLRDFRRELGPLLTDLGKTLTEVKATLAALLERERTRAERLAARDALLARPLTSPITIDDDEFTGPIDVRPTAATPARGVPSLPYSQHRPKTQGGG